MALVKSDNLKPAYDVFVLRYYREAIRYCRSMVHEEDMACDLVQDSFADLYVKREHYPDSVVFKVWLPAFAASCLLLYPGFRLVLWGLSTAYAAAVYIRQLSVITRLSFRKAYVKATD